MIYIEHINLTFKSSLISSLATLLQPWRSIYYNQSRILGWERLFMNYQDQKLTTLNNLTTLNHDGLSK